MEMMRTEATGFKYVIIVVREGREKYVGKNYNPRMCYGCTVKINDAMRFHRPEDAQKAMERYGLEGRIGKIKIQIELVEDDATEQ